MRRSRFFVSMGALLLALVFAGFARTFFLRAFFDVLPIPGYLYGHGAILVAWFALLLVQVSLVARGRTSLHRRLGTAGVLLAAAVVAVTLNAILRLPARIQSADVDGEGVVDFAVVVWLDLVALALFAGFVAAGWYWRARVDVHKRLMLLASVAIVGPATGRLIPFVAAIPVLQLVVVAMPFILPFTLIGHDVLVRRRLHPATAAGVAVYLVLQVGALAVASGPWGQGLLRALE